MKKLVLLILAFPIFVEARLTDQEKFDLIQKSAPLLKFHPKDDSSLASADWYIPRCSLEILKKDGSKETLVPLGSLNQEELVKVLKKYMGDQGWLDPSKGQIFLNPGAGKEPNHKNTLKGPGYENGFSDQHAYYNFVEVSDTYVKISYWYFTPYQGNIDIIPGVNIALNVLKAGSHEGDWEHIDVRWQKIDNAWQILDVFFARHGESKGDLIKKEQVEFVNDLMQSDKNGTHPVVYVAMNSHGTYPKNIFFLSSDVDKTSNKGPKAFLYGKDKEGAMKLEDYNKQPWRPYLFSWGADVTKKFGGSPETPHAYRSFGQGAISQSQFIVKGKQVDRLSVTNGKSPDFKMRPQARIKEIDFKVVGPNFPKTLEFEVWKKNVIWKR